METVWKDPKEQSSITARKDVLTYTSDVLTEDLIIAGPIKLILYVSSTAVDTDFCAKLSDYYPDGKSYYLQSGFLRMRFGIFWSIRP